MSDAYGLWGLFPSPLIQSSRLQWNTHTLDDCTQSEHLQFSLLNNNYLSSPHEYRVCRFHIVSAYAISGTYRRTLISPANLVRLITMLSKHRIKPWDIPDLACAKFDSLPPLFVVFQWAMKISNVQFCQIFHVLGFAFLIYYGGQNQMLYWNPT